MSLALALLALGAPPRLALVVAIDEYAFANRADSADRRLSGAKNDADHVGSLLGLAGFTTRQLLQAQATRASIVRELSSLVARCQKDSDVVFYFSGCGGNSGDARREPTLVPADGKAARPAGDLPMGLVEAMARKATDKGARVTVIVDACFAPPKVVERSLEARAYKPMPKCVMRKGSVRPDVWRGPGVFLSPSNAGGEAYEWRAAAASTSWSGAFTDVIVGAASAAALQGRLPLVRSMVGEAGAYFKPLVSAAYMPGLRVALPANAKDPAYDETFLTAGPLPSLKDPVAADRAKRFAERDRREARTLRIAVDLDPAVAKDQETALRRRIVDLQESLQKADGDLRIVSDYARKPDRVVLLSADGGMTAEVKGGDLTRFERHRFSGSDPDAVVESGLGAYLSRELLAKRLWNLASESSRLEWSPKMVRETIAPGEHIEIAFDAPKPGYLVLLNRDESDGEIKLLAPYWYEPSLYFAAGTQTAPKTLGNAPGSSTGESDVVAIFVPAEEGSLPPLPPYTPGTDREVAEKAFATPLLRYLKALLVQLERPDAVYAVSRLKYKIL